MARASYQNLSHISLGSRSKVRKIKSKKTKPKINHPSIKPLVVLVSGDRTHKPILKLKF